MGEAPDALAAQKELCQQLDLGLLTSGQLEDTFLQVKPQSLSWWSRRIPWGHGHHRKVVKAQTLRPDRTHLAGASPWSHLAPQSSVSLSRYGTCPGAAWGPDGCSPHKALGLCLAHGLPA